MDSIKMHRRAQTEFGRVLGHLTDDDLELPTPCGDWAVDDLIEHVIEGNRWVVDRMGGDGPAPPVDGDRQVRFGAAADHAHTSFAAPGAMDRTVELPFGEIPAGVFMAIRSGDLYTHAWDLATAAGADTDLDREPGEAIQAATAPLLSPALSGEGRPFGEAQPCDADRPVADRLAAFLGRRV